MADLAPMTASRVLGPADPLTAIHMHVVTVREEVSVINLYYIKYLLSCYFINVLAAVNLQLKFP